MPQKTRKEKIIAEKRRKNQNFASITQHNTVNEQSNNVSSNISDYQFKLKENPVKTTNVGLIDTDEFIAIRKDIYKTIFLAGLFLAVEFVTYWRGVN